MGKYEIQLRDYNRNNTAPFSIITDGRQWRFYYSQTGGEFSQKCFKVLDLLNDDAEDMELSFYTFLSKEDIRSGKARNEAETYLKLSQKQRALEDAVPQARRQILEPPFPSLPEALVKIVTEASYTVSIEEAIRFVKKQGAKKPKPDKPIVITPPVRTPLSNAKTKRSLGRKDHTCYDIILAGNEFRMLNKRKAMYKIVRFLCDSGVTPRQITEAAKYRPNHLFRDCEGVVSADEFESHMENIKNQTGRTYERKRYFQEKEQLIVCNGSTYALWNQWGPSTTVVIQELVKSFPQHPIQLTVHEDN